MQAEETADSFAGPLGRVIDRGSGLDSPRIDTKIAELTDIGISHQLEGQGGQRFRIHRRSFLFLPCSGIYAGHRGKIHGRREIIHDRIEQGLHPLILEGGTAEDGRNLEGQRGLPDGRPNLPFRDLLPLDILGQQGLVLLCNSFQELFAVLQGLIRIRRRDLLQLELGPQRFLLPDDRLHPDQIDDAAETDLVS
jgi:hypothetical protein